jgi:hypothetical protein
MAITQAQQDFITKIGAFASADMKQSGVLASLTVAQAILESGWGTSELAVKANALFGIKADSRWGGLVYSKTTQECYDGANFTTVEALFRAYDSWEQSLTDHSAFLTGSPRYAAVIGETDYKTACAAIHAAGYATDPGYAGNLISLIETYNLAAFDTANGKEKQGMNLRKLIFTQNACYKAGRTITPKGIMVHSTGANNPNLCRYVGPDDGLLGKNQYNNHWNQDTPDGRQVCVHGFIGKLADGSVATYQTLPWNHRGWHCGSGPKGSGNDTHISFEICEDALTDPVYFRAAFNEAVELCVYLCKQYGFDPMKDGVIIGHYEGHQRGIASNHGDPQNWFPKHGESMNSFRAAVKKGLEGSAPTPPPAPAPAPATSGSVQKGSLVKLAADAVYYSGKAIPAWVKGQNWIVASISGDRAVIDKNEAGTNAICSPVNVKFLSVVDAAAPAPVPAFSPYLVKVTADSLNIRKGPGTNTAVVGAIKDKGTYTIVEESTGTGATQWGRLKSGAGWISLDYTQKR